MEINCYQIEINIHSQMTLTSLSLKLIMGIAQIGCKVYIIFKDDFQEKKSERLFSSHKFITLSMLMRVAKFTNCIDFALI